MSVKEMIRLKYTYTHAEAYTSIIDITESCKELKDFNNHSWNFFLIFLTLHGILLSYKANNSFHIYAYSALSLGMIYHVLKIRFSENYRAKLVNEEIRDINEESAKILTINVTLEVDDLGLHETVNDIVTHAPWHMIKGYFISNDTLHIKIGEKLFAVIPRKTTDPAYSSIDDLILLLISKNTPMIAPVSQLKSATR